MVLYSKGIQRACTYSHQHENMDKQKPICLSIYYIHILSIYYRYWVYTCTLNKCVWDWGGGGSKEEKKVRYCCNVASKEERRRVKDRISPIRPKATLIKTKTNFSS